MWAEMVRSLSDSILIPLSIQYYPIILKSAVIELKTSQYKDILLKEKGLGKHLVSYLLTIQYILYTAINLYFSGYLETAVQSFENTINEFVEEMKEINKKE